MIAIIFANGQMENPDLERLPQAGLVIAADGGQRHCQALGITPQVVIGDFDSLSPQALESLTAQGVRVVRHPRRKDFTDLELALEYAAAQGADEIAVYGALGMRWDMTLANLLLPAAESLKNTRVRLLDGNQEITLLRAGQAVELNGSLGDTVSLVPVGGDARGVTTRGLEYPLNNETLYFGATRGVSNVMLESPAVVRLAEGLLICTLIHNQPSPGLGGTL